MFDILSSNKEESLFQKVCKPLRQLELTYLIDSAKNNFNTDINQFRQGWDKLSRRFSK